MKHIFLRKRNHIQGNTKGILLCEGRDIREEGKGTPVFLRRRSAPPAAAISYQMKTNVVHSADIVYRQTMQSGPYGQPQKNYKIEIMNEGRLPATGSAEEKIYGILKINSFYQMENGTSWK